MTSRSYFGKMNSILGSVVPLAMFVMHANEGYKIFWHRRDPGPERQESTSNIFQRQNKCSHHQNYFMTALSIGRSLVLLRASRNRSRCQHVHSNYLTTTLLGENFLRQISRSTYNTLTKPQTTISCINGKLKLPSEKYVIIFSYFSFSISVKSRITDQILVSMTQLFIPVILGALQVFISP